MLDPGLHSGLCATLEASLRRALRYEPAARQALARLTGRVLVVELSTPRLDFYLIPGSEGLSVRRYYDDPVNTRLRGSPAALLSLLQGQKPVAQSGVTIVGETGLLLELQRIADQLDLDWEQALGDAVGDLGAHPLGQTLHAVSGWFGSRRARFEDLLGDFLSEELRATPAQPELEIFAREVDEVRLAGDRLAARVDRLAAHIKPSRGSEKP